MKTRRIGATDLVVSQIGFGCGGNAGLMIRGTAAEQERVIGRALDSGINYFDSAPDYGDGLGEENLGRALQALGARPVINTKVEIRAENLGDTADHIVRSVEDSLKRLRVDASEIVQIHNGPVAARPDLQGRDYRTLWLEDYFRPGGAIEGVRRILESGKTRYAGFISRGSDAIEARELLKTGYFHLVNVSFSLLNPTAGHPRPDKLAVDQDYGNVIGIAQAAGAGTAIFSPLAGGILTDAVISGQHTHMLARPKDVKALEAKGALPLARRFQALAAEHGISLMRLAYGFILSHPDVSTAVGGYSAIEQLDETIAAVAEMDTLPKEIMGEIQQIWAAG
jgi:aryl-alcohol dehydrogenase-like predicted oxidoreductase